MRKENPNGRNKGTQKARKHVRGCKGDGNKKILKLLFERGWFVVRSKRHYVLEHTESAQHITLPRTSSDHRSTMQTITLLRRCLGIDLRPYV